MLKCCFIVIKMIVRCITSFYWLNLLNPLSQDNAGQLVHWSSAVIGQTLFLHYFIQKLELKRKSPITFSMSLLSFEGILTEIQQKISVVYKLCSSFEISTDGFCVTIQKRTYATNNSESNSDWASRWVARWNHTNRWCTLSATQSPLLVFMSMIEPANHFMSYKNNWLHLCH